MPEIIYTILLWMLVAIGAALWIGAIMGKVK